ncbi:predicted protein [Naegleria gruberi]|uniref:Predicted protein n=1 Tax=Naegleria gruberi TaxID=5762 RepID=D2VWR8_NAEGR|nr:uncharacterized protein NAEGRDRAFT_81505 [Naegleria gruberi]EFC38670.1 predicted protein [Naegleria gruberi]|eukprot:XP_002671414.1 predicted protein [Naegleria gruberi strain NEG-M]
MVESVAQQLSTLSISTGPFQSDGEHYKLLKNYEQIDAHAKSIPSSETSTLTQLVTYLTKPFSSIEEKARSIFVWICENVVYDAESFLSNQHAVYVPSEHDKFFSEDEKKMYCPTSRLTFIQKKGVCSGYARLFKNMCIQSGIQKVSCVVGFAKLVGFNPLNPVDIKESNHEWNAVELEDGSLRLIDACWGAGVLGGSSFQKIFTSRYFFMSPNEMIASHYPEDPKLQLISPPVSPDDFVNRVRIKLKAASARVDGHNIIISVCVPQPGVIYQLSIFAGVRKCEEMLTYFVRVEGGANIEEVSYPSEYGSWKTYAGELISPKTGKMKVGTTYSFKIQFPADKMVAMVMIPPSDQLVSKGNGLFEGEYTPTAPGKVNLVGGSGSRLEGLLAFDVV